MNNKQYYSKVAFYGQYAYCKYHDPIQGMNWIKKIKYTGYEQH